jgi:chemosensory pili system protein ChpC
MTGPADELYCLLVPLADERLLVPRSCVTEVINYQAPTPMEAAPPWYLGTIAWGGRRVPLVSFEAACGRNVPRASGRTRLVVMQGISEHLQAAGGNFAVLTQGFNEYPLVPDFERLEQMIEEETRAA